MKSFKLTIFILIITGLLFFGCTKQKTEEKDTGTIIAKVNNEVLKLEEIMLGYELEEWNKFTDKQKKNIINEWIELTLLSQKAEKDNLDKTEHIKFKIKMAVKKVKANALLGQAIDNIDVSENELFDYYRARKNKYKNGEKSFKIQRIFVKDANKLNLVINKMKNGLKFNEAAKKYSEESIGKNGGYVKWITKNDVSKKMWSTLIGLKKWYYKSIKEPNGYYIVRYYDVKVNPKKFEDVKDEIRKEVARIKQRSVLDNVVDGLKKQSTIEIFNLR